MTVPTAETFTRPDGLTVTLYLGDCLDVLPTLAAGSVDAVITDPPYILAAGSHTHMNGKAGTWADMMNAAYWFSAWYRHCWRIIKPTGAMWTFCNWRTLPIVQRAAIDAKMPITSVAVWDKVWIGPGGNQGLRPRYELIALMAKPDFAIPDRGISDILECLWSAVKPSGHPAEKPAALIGSILDMCELRQGSVVLDPFFGSGTTGDASIKRGFSVIGCEQESDYYAIARRRILEALAQPALFQV